MDPQSLLYDHHHLLGRGEEDFRSVSVSMFGLFSLLSWANNMYVCTERLDYICFICSTIDAEKCIILSWKVVILIFLQLDCILGI